MRGMAWLTVNKAKAPRCEAHGKIDSRQVRTWRASSEPHFVGSSLIRDPIHHVADETAKGLVLDELLVDLRVVLQEVLHHLG